ncbi:dephospho-CoA kinase [Aureimonas sp. Leaf454]|uniref:dephospho-CoA kinase n=1 Tax=Aureimonas sp. Leaf454 TaxID=1736381 RepID=UPI0006F6118A|nr:dephospho-CoA kinase [Aureimonas sp. Leaf454]KQT43185.1 dephospho-CoA kinase [Aureimonas sp. Leaf454]
MIVLGLTGSIGMGKSATAALFEEEGVPVHSADAAVHRLYAGKAAPAVEALFSGTVVEGVVDRERLAARVLGDAEALKALEALVHPLVREEETAFLDAARARGEPLVVLDIPLLFETAGEGRVDRILVVTAPADVQRARILARPGMTPERFAAILDKQMPDAEKRRRADVVIDTSRGFDAARAEVRALVERLRRESPT